MIYIDQKVEQKKLHDKAEADVIFADISNMAKMLEGFGLTKVATEKNGKGPFAFFESHGDMDYMALRIPINGDVEDGKCKLYIYVTHNRLFFFHNDNEIMSAFIHEIETAEGDEAPREQILNTFFSRITMKDIDELEQIEDEIGDMEDNLSSAKSDDYTDRISALRKKLLTLKRYYESLVDLLEDLCENQNCILSKLAVKRLQFQQNRADRMFRTVLNLRDYVTQVREAYQAQMDIELNKTMRFFTVVATVFLPPTLIVGWYGMNFKMPEYSYSVAYPIVIVLTLIVMVGSILYLKKRKWF